MFYKIVQEDHHNNRLTSCRTCFEDGGIVYKVGEWVGPSIPDSMLLVFGNLESAIDFEDQYPGQDDLLFEVETVGAVTITQLCLGLYSSFEDWWVSTDPEKPSFEAPKGTHGAKAVKLLNYVEWPEISSRRKNG